VQFRQLQGANEEGLTAGQRLWEGSGWVAALLPATTAFNGAPESAYQGRYLSNEGRLFFNGLGALVPQDVNENWDVYEREPAGLGSCSSASSGFDSNSSGCTELISSGSAPQESAFLDASESGGDVFFATGARLTPADIDANRDIYDAHICSGASPCIAQAPEVPPPCVNESSCRPAPAPQPPIFGPPASATFTGPGNLAQPPAPVVKPKKPTRAELLAKALKTCHKRYPKSKQRRGACERQARAKYGAKKAPAKKGAKKSAKGGGR
jgi:hypothetical protein